MPKDTSLPFRFQSPEESPGYLLWQVTMLWQRLIKRALDPLGLTHTQFVLLAALGWLSKQQEQVTQVDIATHSNTDKMMVSKVLRTLQEKGFVERQEHKADTRAKSIRLTKAGQQALQKSIKVVEQVDHEFFATLKTDEPRFRKGMLTLIRDNDAL